MVPRAQLGQLLGNAMSVNVLERIFHQLFLIPNLWPREIETQDRWKSGDALRALQLTRNRKLQSSFTKPSGYSALPGRYRGVCLNVMHRTRQLIVDSGASFHLVDIETLTPAEKALMRPVDEPIAIATANGEVWSEQETEVYIQCLDLTVTALVLTNTPSVLSIGLLSSDGWGFNWPPHSDNPYVYHGDKDNYILKTQAKYKNMHIQEKTMYKK